jgi:hypothetical protein
MRARYHLSLSARVCSHHACMLSLPGRSWLWSCLWPALLAIGRTSGWGWPRSPPRGRTELVASQAMHGPSRRRDGRHQADVVLFSPLEPPTHRVVVCLRCPVALRPLSRCHCLSFHIVLCIGPARQPCARLLFCYRRPRPAKVESSHPGTL